MTKLSTRICAIAVLAGATAMAIGLGPSQAADIGKQEYETYCALCHGKSGKGDGPFGGIINKKVVDLTVLAKNNGGVFPFDRAYETISGAAEVVGHGTREMPIWGDHYSEKASRDLGPYYQPSDVSSYVRGKILALIGYISTLQAK